jgi:hypothetical protein
MADSTPLFELPFILPGQAQKELFHNEALVRIDAALHPAVEEGPRSSPPGAPGPGACWIVGPAASGAWQNRENQLAFWTEGGWRFLAPRPGMSVLNKAEQARLVFEADGWGEGPANCSGLYIAGQRVVGERQPGVASPSGGTVIDQEARAAIAAITAALMSHGLIE